MNAVRGVCDGSLATRQRAKKEVEKMKITKTINTTIVSTAVIEVKKDGHAEMRAEDILLYSCDPLSADKIAKEVRKIDPKAVILSVEQHANKYAVDIEEFVQIAHVEQ